MQQNEPSTPPEGKPPVVDPNLQIKFTIIFGVLALIPFVLFYFFGLEIKPDEKEEGERVGAARFEAVTAEAGIKFVHENGAEGEKLLPETMGGGCAFFDYDNDGDQDLLLVNSSAWPWSKERETATMGLYANDGAGGFEDVAAEVGLDFTFYGMGAAVGDYDGDGFVDVLFTGVGGNRLFRNEGGKAFHEVSKEAGLAQEGWSTSAAFMDYDNDGDLDLFICNYVQWSREIDQEVNYQLPGVGRAYGPPMNFAGTFPLLYRNEGSGRFTDVSAVAGVQVTNKATGLPMAKSLGVSPVDLDNDGWIDLVVANDTVQNFVFRNNGNGTFTEMGGKSGLAYDRFGSTRGAMGIDTARLQGEDNLAISIGNFANEMTALYVASRDPLSFSDEAINAGIGDVTRNLLTFGVFFFDYDLDGALDLLTANGHIEPEIERVHPNQSYRQPAQLFWNRGSGVSESGFAPVQTEKAGTDLYAPMVGRGSAYADIDGDGDLDVVITQIGGAPRLLRNRQDTGHSWVRVKLVGTKSNRDAIGAWVRLRVGNRVLSQQVMPTRGYLSQSELPVTFGLGQAERIDEAQIIWPGGERQTGVQLKANTLNVVRQPR